MKNFELKIVRASAALFAENGVAKVCPDDLIRETGADTAMFYRYFPCKDTLLRSVVQYYLKIATQRLKICGAVSPNAVFELQHFFSQAQRSLTHLSPVFMTELKADYPDTYELLLLTGRTLLLSFLETNLQRGIREGLFPQHVQAKRVINWYILQLQVIVFDRPHEYAGAQSEAVAFFDRFFLRLSVNDAGQRMISDHRSSSCQDEIRASSKAILPSWYSLL